MCWLCANAAHRGFSAEGVPRPGYSGAPVFGIEQIIQQLRTSWGGQWENDTYPLHNTTVYYALLTNAPLDSSSPENAGWQAMSALMVTRAAEAFELWDDLIAINLNQYVGNPPAGAHVIQFAYSSTTDSGGTYEFGDDYVFHGASPYGGDEWGVTRAEIWLNTSWTTHGFSSAINQSGYSYYGGYGFTTYLHEIGHALGLSHPGSYNAGNGTITYENSAEYLQDTRRYTLMSYFDADEDGSGTDHYGSTGTWRYGQTPLLHDILAIQAIYGADPNTRTGNTTYGFNSNAGKDVYDFSKNGNPIIAIYDAGGTDTLDLSGFGAGQYGGQRIDLNPGSYSDVGGYMTNNLAIAFNTIIENAIGGSGNDTITGNSVANALTGGAGNDTLYGGDGNDTLDGGLGADLLYGQIGDDTFLFSSPSNGADTIFDFGGNDKIALKGSAFGGLAAGSLSAAGVDFSYGSAAGSSGPELFYNAANNRLYWDADGTGAGAAVELAYFGSTGLGGALGTIGSNFSFEAAGDFDKNGISDVLWRDAATGATGAWLINGNGTRTWSDMGIVASGWDAKISGDFDGSGTTDVLWRNDATGAAGAWLMRDGQPTGWLSLGSPALDWEAKGAGDFDKNGIDDIIWVNNVTRAAGAWLMNASGQPGGWLNLGTLNPGWEFKGVGDFNGDGTDDVLFYNTVTRAAGAWKIRNGAPADWFDFGTIEADWAIDSVVDLNGDGTDDLHLYNATTDSAKSWTVVNGIVTGPLGQPGFDGNWSLAGSGQFDGTGGEDLLWRNTVDGTVAINSLGLTANHFIII